jgi:uncharacterized protein with PQ loop repeat
MLWNWPMMLANAVTFLLAVVIVAMKLDGFTGWLC